MGRCMTNQIGHYYWGDDRQLYEDCIGKPTFGKLSWIGR